MCLLPESIHEDGRLDDEQNVVEQWCFMYSKRLDVDPDNTNMGRSCEGVMTQTQWKDCFPGSLTASRSDTNDSLMRWLCGAMIHVTSATLKVLTT